MRTRLTDAFAIQHPVLCAPMALVTGGRLAAAVSAAGGLGIVGGGYAGILGGEPDLQQELTYVRGHKFGIGFITWALERAPHLLDEVLAHSPDCVFLSFGDPGPFASRIRRSGAKLICQVQSLRHVDQAIDAGADVIVAQGTEAGGHGAQRSTMPSPNSNFTKSMVRRWRTTSAPSSFIKPSGSSRKVSCATSTSMASAITMSSALA